MEAIVLCGGLGTRLRAVVKDVPKPMAAVGGKPFLEFIFEYLKKQGVKSVVLAVSYKYEVIQEHFKNEFLGIKIKYSIEQEPLGTGGAIKQALKLCEGREVFVLNGDSIFEISLKNLRLKGAKICLALKKMFDFQRYGAVSIDEKGEIVEFKEKSFCKEGLINGGIYLLSKDIFERFSFLGHFSFEEFLSTNFKVLKARAELFEDYFIDIGIPQDYEKFSRLKGER
ncbi:sugar-phosphate nucleotidyltransferase [Campylobacter vulpis]|uniref:D-glycero-D-manno-heptose 1-phosphate guanosyltransferase n=1 Tax=Campylobacter vulpis TaxID=1655500 RepID=UPI000C1515BB|nr:nucleotidyltransferase family protein [Campylobacter vulpis]MBS4276159.1 D-glycero-D-manno-heptose 1-phosphate guanosyltransferase [Campylobacter vulpis]MBS4307599.1 D-glycero-D-manno-heptose 1-phosphate guanosyltransferase [Campylobacter vulpis]MBS4424067.1 D-glycero-D-manno-heptose 1-phosphate guanosyltransferase [Campylobacter vulpis]PHY90506.1 D-glycero-D-manno-heptose 1-phosphate guanosyltransferase [Campylobacter vulpis]QNF78501.1 sugar-phosphate nucleotidyltransferase [Campylobacter 